MPCNPLPTPPAPPALPAGISITPTIPTPSFDPNACCKVVEFPPIDPLVALPTGAWGAAASALVAPVMSGIESVIDATAFKCPKE